MEGRWEDWLLKLPEQARTERVPPDTPRAKHAVLAYRCLGVGNGCTLLEIRPETGRMHQIRVQAATRGWPVLGDVLYGSRQPFGPPAPLPRDRAIALHARSLTFLHPIRYEPVTITAPLPAFWNEMPWPPSTAEGRN
jgi:23S rRNA pseudouridine1911/1915/1917 synthase